MRNNEWLATEFEQHRAHLRQVATRLLGPGPGADDAVQEAWLRLARADTASVANLRGWLTTVVSRIALDMARATGRRPIAPEPDDNVAIASSALDPATEAEMADSVGAALLIVLDRLSPTERLAFVLHDTFGVPFEEIGPILSRSPAAAKQLASRARNKVRGADPTGEPDTMRQREVVAAFLNAARNGDFAGLVAVLHPDIVLEADDAAARMGAPTTTSGADAVAAMFSGRALGADVAIVDGYAGLAWIVNGATKVAWNFYVDDAGHVVHINMHADQTTIDQLTVEPA